MIARAFTRPMLWPSSSPRCCGLSIAPIAPSLTIASPHARGSRLFSHRHHTPSPRSTQPADSPHPPHYPHAFNPTPVHISPPTPTPPSPAPTPATLPPHRPHNHT